MLPLEQKTTRGVVMKRLNIVIAPCITVVALATLFLTGWTGAAAAIPTQHTHNAGSCGAWSQALIPTNCCMQQQTEQISLRKPRRSDQSCACVLRRRAAC